MLEVDVVRDAPQRPQGAIDESVQIPEQVKRATAIADAFYKAEAAKQPAAVDPNAPISIVETPPSPPAQPAVQAAEISPQPVSGPAEISPQTETRPDLKVPAPEQWEHRFLSMKGRYEQSQRTLGQTQQQLQEVGEELMRTHQMMERTSPNGPVLVPPLQPQQPQYLTPEDTQQFGPDLINVTKKAALEAVAPHLQQLEQENQQLRQNQVQISRQQMFRQLNAAIPNWRAINNNPRWLNWLSLPDLYSGAVRQQLLNDAFNAAQAPRVIAFFRGFLREEAATGNSPPPQQGQQQAPPPAPPRQPGVALETLAAPGRAKPAPGQSEVPAEKPIYTHASIKAFYKAVVNGLYAGREQQKIADEQAIFLAQREGRVRG